MEWIPYAWKHSLIILAVSMKSAISSFGDSQMHRCEGFFLIESPDMQFMDGFDAGNLEAG